MGVRGDNKVSSLVWRAIPVEGKSRAACGERSTHNRRGAGSEWSMGWQGWREKDRKKASERIGSVGVAAQRPMRPSLPRASSVKSGKADKN